MPPDILARVFGDGLLMVDLQHLRGFAARVGQLDDPEMNRRHPAEKLARSSHKYEVRDGIAAIDLQGPIVGRADWMLDYWGMDYTVAPHFAAAIREADARSDVRQIVVNTHTPGGSVVGLQAAFEAVRDARKPVVAAVAGLCASAGLYMIAAADSIIAEPAALVGSIGTVTTIRDWSKLFEDSGIVTHVVSTGPLKGMGTPGSEVTPAHLASLQRMVDALGAQFIAAVAEGRGLSIEQVQALATGEVWIGAAAQAVGLVDRISSTALAAASTTAKELSRMNTQEMAQVLAAHPQHGALIAKMADEDVDAVKAAIQKADVEAKIADLTARAESAEAKATAAEAKLAEAEAARVAAEAKATAAEAKAAAALALGDAAGDDPGGSATSGSGKPTEAELSARWEKMDAKQRAPYLGAKTNFISEQLKKVEV